MDHLAEKTCWDHLAIHEMVINASSVFPDTFENFVYYLGRKEVVCCSQFTPYDERTTTFFPAEFSLRNFPQGAPIEREVIRTIQIALSLIRKNNTNPSVTIIYVLFCPLKSCLFVTLFQKMFAS